jgi:hypothetical protein
MKVKNRIYKWLFAVWLLMCCQPMLCAFQPATMPSAWRTTPTLSTDRQMSYQFRSTSAYTPTMNTTVYTPGSSTPFGAPTRPRRSGSGDIDEEEDDPIGDPMGYIDTPVGEPLVLLLMAVVYLILLKKRKKVQKNLVMS